MPGFKTVSVNVSWTPGYSGGFDQEFSIHYRKKGSNVDFTEESVGHPPNNMHTVKKLRPRTEYEFKLQSSNTRGRSGTSPVVQVQTPGKKHSLAQQCCSSRKLLISLVLKMLQLLCYQG